MGGLIRIIYKSSTEFFTDGMLKEMCLPDISGYGG
jgi:hypothetical protein